MFKIIFFIMINNDRLDLFFFGIINDKYFEVLLFYVLVINGL